MSDREEEKHTVVQRSFSGGTSTRSTVQAYVQRGTHLHGDDLLVGDADYGRVPVKVCAEPA